MTSINDILSADNKTVDALIAFFDARTGHEELACSNTPVEVSHNPDLYFSIDWLSLTVWDADHDVLREMLACLGQDFDELEDLERGFNGYFACFQGAHGFRFSLYPSNGEHGNHCQLLFPGAAISSQSGAAVIKFFDLLCDWGGRWQCSRLDLAFDTQKFKPWHVTEALLLGQFESRVHRKNLGIHADLFGLGYTQTVGDRSSNKYVRVYHKQDEQRFDNQWFTRVEIELKGKVAFMALLDLIAAGAEHFSVRAMGFIRSFIDFKTDWWVSFCDGAASIRVSPRVPETDLGRISRWLSRSVAPALALYVDIEHMGNPAGLQEMLLHYGRDRWSPRHERILKDEVRLLHSFAQK